MPPTLTETAMAALGLVLCIVACPIVLAIGVPIIGFAMGGLHAIGVLPHG